MHLWYLDEMTRVHRALELYYWYTTELGENARNILYILTYVQLVPTVRLYIAKQYYTSQQVIDQLTTMTGFLQSNIGNLVV